MEEMQGLLKRYDVCKWTKPFLKKWNEIVEKQRKCRPELAKPDKELYELLESISQYKNTEIVLITGRDKRTMQKWFNNSKIQIIAEHGAFSRKNNEWTSLTSISDDWKKEIYPILEVFVDRTPGTFIEEKELSLVWHYRKVDSDLANARVRELIGNNPCNELRKFIKLLFETEEVILK